MSFKDIANNFDKQKLKGIKSITKYPSIDVEKFKNYGGLYLQKYFIDTGVKPNKMVSFGAKDKSFSNPILFIIYDLNMIPGLIFEFKEGSDENKFLDFVSNFFIKGKFIANRRKRKLKEHIETINEDKDQIDSAIKTIQFMSFLPAIASLLLIASYYFKQMKYASEEYYVNTTLEKELNKQLFQGQTKEESAFKIFSNLENYINLILDKKMNSLILCGPPGMSKTYMVRRTLHFTGKTPGKDYRIEKGSSLGLNSVYQLLYANKNKLLILDDFDTPLSNEDVINLMKAVTDSYGKRIVSLPPEKTISSQGSNSSDAPNKFEFSGQIIIITNKKKGDLDLALRSRSPVVEVAFDSKQIIEAMDKLIRFIAPQIPYDKKLEVLNYIKLLQKNDANINVSFRSVKSSIDARVGNENDWKEMVRLIVDYKGKTSLKEMLLTNKLDNLYYL